MAFATWIRSALPPKSAAVQLLEHLLPWLVLAILLLYTYHEFFHAPYLGFNFNPSTGAIQGVYPSTSLLQIDDRIIQVGDLPFAVWQEDLRRPLFPALSAGQTLPLLIRSNGIDRQIVWPVAGPTLGEVASRILNLWWLGYFFWLAGIATLLFVRPKDTQYRLLVCFFLLTAIWLVVGNTSRWRFWESAIIYRSVIWLFVPVALHLHWVFLQPLARLPRPILWAGYGLGVLAATHQWVQRLPINSYSLALAGTLLLSLGLLAAHYVRQPQQRPRLRLVFAALFFATLPMIGLGVAEALRVVPNGGPAALLVLPLLPGAYFYTFYRYPSATIELRTNRLIALYLFLILLGTLLLVLLALIYLLPAWPGESLWISLGVGLFTTLLGIFAFLPFQRWVERRLLAIPLPPTTLLATYVTRITTSLTEPGLVQLLRNEVLPALLIRQSALLQMRAQRARPIYLERVVDAPQLSAGMLACFQRSEVYHARPPERANDPDPSTAWVRVGFPLHVEGRLVGVWLLGQRDPDDLYSARDLALLQTLAGQTALALVNIDQSTELQALYQANIRRQEEERTQLAHVLHDEILNQAAILYMSLDGNSLTPQVSANYVTLKQQIRRMVQNLRPPSLNLGLYVALEELAFDLDQRAQRAQPTTDVVFAVRPSTAHYPEQVENYLYHIIQQACANALSHAQASTLIIDGFLQPDHVRIVVGDDGIGFDASDVLDWSDLLANKHFGLVHMRERAAQIGAELVITSTPGWGTQVTVEWSNPDPADQD